MPLKQILGDAICAARCGIVESRSCKKKYYCTEQQPPQRLEELEKAVWQWHLAECAECKERLIAGMATIKMPTRGDNAFITYEDRENAGYFNIGIDCCIAYIRAMAKEEANG